MFNVRFCVRLVVSVKDKSRAQTACLVDLPCVRQHKQGVILMNQRTYYSEEAKQRAMRERGIIVALMLSLGLGIGAALALLFAPKQGDELRHDLVDTLEDRFSSVERQVADLRGRVEERIGSR
jgi:hypothetical protein